MLPAGFRLPYTQSRAGRCHGLAENRRAVGARIRRLEFAGVSTDAHKGIEVGASGRMIRSVLERLTHGSLRAFDRALAIAGDAAADPPLGPGRSFLQGRRKCLLSALGLIEGQQCLAVHIERLRQLRRPAASLTRCLESGVRPAERQQRGGRIQERSRSLRRRLLQLRKMLKRLCVPAGIL